MDAGERKPCEACGEPLVGAAHANTGTVAPIHVAPDREDRGNVLLWREHYTGTMKYAVVPNSTMRVLLRDLGVPLRLNHFAACPDAARFRR